MGHHNSPLMLVEDKLILSGCFKNCSWSVLCRLLLFDSNSNWCIFSLMLTSLYTYIKKSLKSFEYWCSYVTKKAIKGKKMTVNYLNYFSFFFFLFFLKCVGLIDISAFFVGFENPKDLECCFPPKWFLYASMSLENPWRTQMMGGRGWLQLLQLRSQYWAQLNLAIAEGKGHHMGSALLLQSARTEPAWDQLDPHQCCTSIIMLVQWCMEKGEVAALHGASFADMSGLNHLLVLQHLIFAICCFCCTSEYQIRLKSKCCRRYCMLLENSPIK